MAASDVFGESDDPRDTGVDGVDNPLGEIVIGQRAEDQHDRCIQCEVRILVPFDNFEKLELLNDHVLAHRELAQELNETRAIRNDILFSWIFNYRLEKLLLNLKILRKLFLHEKVAISDFKRLSGFGNDIK